MTKNQIISKAKSIILEHANPERIYLYGSQVNGEAKVGSDIDIAYDDADFKKDYLIQEDLEKIETLISIDVKNIANTEDRFKNRVKSTAKVIYSATKKLRAEDGLYNFINALDRFDIAIKKEQDLKDEGFGDVYLDLIVKRFEFSYEMAWKALKRYLEFLGFDIKSPRDSFKTGYAQNILEDEAIWLEMIEQRNLSSHIYDEYRNAFFKLKERLVEGLS